MKLADKATEEDIEAATSDTKWVTPKGAKELGSTIVDVATGKRMKLKGVFAGYESTGIKVNYNFNYAKYPVIYYYNYTDGFYYVSITKSGSGSSSTYAIYLNIGIINNGTINNWSTRLLGQVSGPDDTSKVVLDTSLLYLNNTNPILYAQFLPYGSYPGYVYCYNFSSYATASPFGSNMVFNSSTNIAFFTSLYSGYITNNNATNKSVYRGASLFDPPSSSPLTSITCASGKTIDFLAGYGKYLYFITADSYNSEASILTQLDLSTGSTSAQTLQNLHFIDYHISGGSMLYGMAWGLNNNHGDKLFYLNLSNGENNANDIQYTATRDTKSYSYIGDVNGKGIFLEYKLTCYKEYNYSAKTWTIYTLDNSHFDRNIAYYNTWNIPHYKARKTLNTVKNNLVSTGSIVLDIKNKTVYPSPMLCAPSLQYKETSMNSPSTNHLIHSIYLDDYSISELYRLEIVDINSTRPYYWVHPRTKDLVGGDTKYLYLNGGEA